jgi:hypothetical protein
MVSEVGIDGTSNSGQFGYHTCIQTTSNRFQLEKRCLRGIFGSHLLPSYKQRRFQRARSLAEVIVSYMPAVTPEPTTCRLPIFVYTLFYTSKQQALSKMRRNGLRDISIRTMVRRRYAAVVATLIYMISTGKGNPRRTRFSRRRWNFSEHVNGLSARQFCRMYRLSKEAFQQLATVISEHR